MDLAFITNFTELWVALAIIVLAVLLSWRGAM